MLRGHNQKAAKMGFDFDFALDPAPRDPTR